MRTATIVLAAVALVGGAHGAVVPRSEPAASVTPAADDDVTFSIADFGTESATWESATAPIETSTETAPAETEITETTSPANPTVELFTCLSSIGAACGECMTLEGGIDSKCLSDCFKDEANLEIFDKKCPMLPLRQFMHCHDTLKETCGKCTEVKGEVFGVQVLEVDSECFETCYWANRDALREAGPLPTPVQKVVECHKYLAEKCGECVDDGHEIDGHCLLDCYGQHEAELDDFCPKPLIDAVAHLSDLIPDLDFDEVDLDIEDFLSNLLSGLDMPIDVHGIFGHHDGDDDDDEGEDDENDDGKGFGALLAALQGNGGDLQSAINGFLQQLSAQSDDDEDEEEGILAALLDSIFDRHGSHHHDSSASATVAMETEDANPTTTATEKATES